LKRHLWLATLAVCVTLISPESRVCARTWRVTTDGSGDAPFLEAAMDSAVSGDIVLLAPGEYTIGPISVTSGILLRSEAGPVLTRLLGHPGVNSGLSCSQLGPTEISGFWFEGYDDVTFTGLGAITAVGCFRLYIHDCVFANNGKAGIALSANDMIDLENNTFVGNQFAVYGYGGTGLAKNNIFWDRLTGAIPFNPFCNDVLKLGDLPLAWRSANFSVDPQFCGQHDYRILTTSPCAPGNTPLTVSCGLVGALPAECSPTSVEATSWGAVKALYRH
jgi:parallel beta-helix repeat protein